MEKMILRWAGCGHDIEFPRPLCGGEGCLCATCHPHPVHVSPGKCHRCDVKRSRIAVLRIGPAADPSLHHQKSKVTPLFDCHSDTGSAVGPGSLHAPYSSGIALHSPL